MISCSVIIPSLNQGRFIAEAIDSVLAQANAGVGIDLIVVDGGSSDETARVVGRARNHLSWICERDAGQSDAINKGLARARGSFVTWLGADDALAPGALLALSAALLDAPTASLACGAVIQVDEQGRAFGVIAPAWPPERDRLLSTFTYMQQAGTLMRASALRRAGNLDVSLHYAMDLDLWLRLLALGHGVRVMHPPVARARYHRSAKTLLHAAAMADESARVRLRHGAPLLGAAMRMHLRWRYLNLQLRPLRRRIRRLLGQAATFDPYG